MNKARLIPKLAIEGIRKNSSSYFPYILITVFSVFVFFIFNAISSNPMMGNMPHAAYLIMLMMIGIILLAIILLPILYSTNQFLMKQRKGELGLYNVLGLDRKYIAIMMLVESLVLYVISVGIGILMSLAFSRLIFLVLLNLTGLDIECQFIASKESYIITLIYFAVVFTANFLGNLWQLIHVKPIEMIKSGKKGERLEKGLGIKTLIGMMVLGTGYVIAIKCEINSNIFLLFFLAVFFVVIGTRILFRTGTILALKKFKSMPNIYYKKHNFITISGMIYRMKRSAQSLSNICIFSTMIMITLICTVTLFIDKDNAIRFNYPMEVGYYLKADTFTEKAALNEQIQTLASVYDVKVKDQISFNTQFAAMLQEGNRLFENVDRDWFLDNSYSVKFLTIEEYNQLAKTQIKLEDHEVLIFSPTKDFGYDTIYLNDTLYNVKEELQSLSFSSKQPRDITKSGYYIILPNQQQVSYWAEAMHATKPDNLIYNVYFNLEGKAENKDAYVKALNTWMMHQQGGTAADYIGEWAQETEVMYGGLLFLGIFFGIIFGVCLVLMMYYKQITEGYEDQRNFKTLKQVGMSNQEIKGTIKRQILVVFFLPLIGAILHTFIGLFIVRLLIGTLHVYNDTVIIGSSIGIMVVFTLLYVMSYLWTSRAYYKIVR